MHAHKAARKAQQSATELHPHVVPADLEDLSRARHQQFITLTPQSGDVAVESTIPRRTSTSFLPQVSL